MNANFFTFKISEKITEDSQEYKSLTDFQKLDSFYHLVKPTNFELHPKPRIFNIPITNLKIFHQQKATIGSDGSVLVDGKYFQKTPNKIGIEKLFDYVKNLSIKTIKHKSDFKAYTKNLFFRFFSYKAYKNRKILANPNVAKILFFETAYDNLYHFIFQYYPSLLALIEYCKSRQIDYYIIMPPKCNRGFRFNTFYNGFIRDIIKIEKIKKDKMIFIDYQNYEVKNLYHTNFPTENPPIQLLAIKKIQNSLFDSKRQKNIGGGDRIYISRKKATRRFLVNEIEVKKILEHEYGFQTYYMEDYTLEEKVHIMSNSSVVLSVDGTSMINAIFSMQKHVKAIAIRPHDFTEAVAIAIAPFKHVEYLPIIASIANEKYEGYEGIWYTSDLFIKPSILRQKLKDYGIFPLE